MYFVVKLVIYFWLNVQIRNTPPDLINHHVEKHSVVITISWQGYNIMCMSCIMLYGRVTVVVVVALTAAPTAATTTKLLLQVRFYGLEAPHVQPQTTLIIVPHIFLQNECNRQHEEKITHLAHCRNFTQS